MYVLSYHPDQFTWCRCMIAVAKQTPKNFTRCLLTADMVSMIDRYGGRCLHFSVQRQSTPNLLAASCNSQHDRWHIQSLRLPGHRMVWLTERQLQKLLAFQLHWSRCKRRLLQHQWRQGGKSTRLVFIWYISQLNHEGPVPTFYFADRNLKAVIFDQILGSIGDANVTVIINNSNIARSIETIGIKSFRGRFNVA